MLPPLARGPPVEEADPARRVEAQCTRVMHVIGDLWGGLQVQDTELMGGGGVKRSERVQRLCGETFPSHGVWWGDNVTNHNSNSNSKKNKQQ